MQRRRQRAPHLDGHRTGGVRETTDARSPDELPRADLIDCRAPVADILYSSRKGHEAAHGLRLHCRGWSIRCNVDEIFTSCFGCQVGEAHQWGRFAEYANHDASERFATDCMFESSQWAGKFPQCRFVWGGKGRGTPPGGGGCKLARSTERRARTFHVEEHLRGDCLFCGLRCGRVADQAGETAHERPE